MAPRDAAGVWATCYSLDPADRRLRWHMILVAREVDQSRVVGQPAGGLCEVVQAEVAEPEPIHRVVREPRKPVDHRGRDEDRTVEPVDQFPDLQAAMTRLMTFRDH